MCQEAGHKILASRNITSSEHAAYARALVGFCPFLRLEAFDVVIQTLKC